MAVRVEAMGDFDVGAAHAVAALVRGAGGVTVDLTRARRIDPLALAYVVERLGRAHAVRLRGLTRREERLLRYLGELGAWAEPAARAEAAAEAGGLGDVDAAGEPGEPATM